MAKQSRFSYNSSMQKQSQSPLKSSNVEHDPRLFTWFLTLVMCSMYALAILENPALRQPGRLVIFTLLMTTHILLHWMIEKVMINSMITLVYILEQGALGFFICWMAGHEAVIFAIFLALLGETVGMLGLTHTTLLSAIYYLSLAIINIRHIMDAASTGWLFLGIIPVIIFVITYVILYRRQADAREEAQNLAAELEVANRQLSEYATQVEDLTIANERQRMARELHDTLSQGLTGIILQLEAVEAHLNNSRPEKAKAIIANAKLQARTTLTDARSAIDDLRQSTPQDLGAALRLEISRFTSATDIPCSQDFDELPALPEAVQETITRTVSEALTNIARHAHAQQVRVKLAVAAEHLRITISDDGLGFDPLSVPPGHYGLLGIQERIRLSGGELQIHSQPGSGTTLEIRMPR